MIDIHLPTTDGRHIVMSRYTQPDKDVSLLLAQLGLSLPDQPPPKVYASGQIGLECRPFQMTPGIYWLSGLSTPRIAKVGLLYIDN